VPLATRKFIDGELLRIERMRRRLQWAAWEAETGRTKQAWCAYIRGERTVAPSVIAKAEALLQLEPGQLTAGVDQEAAGRRARELRRQRAMRRPRHCCQR